MKKIKYLVMDVDGTLTDGKIYMSHTGEMCKAFNIKDGCGIHDIVIPKGIILVVITGRNSDIVTRRCEEIGIIEVHQGVKDKLKKLLSITQELAAVAYIGDDINDLSCMQQIEAANGLIGCPFDAVRKVKAIADFVSNYRGGEGAVRDFIEWIVAYENRKEIDSGDETKAIQF